MIYTLTLNPSIDYIMHVNEFTLGTLHRANETHFYPGGKGINVSRVLKRLGIENTALGYVGGFAGLYIKEALENESVCHDFIYTEGNTRINVKLKSSEESEINGPGPLITKEQQEALFKKIETLSPGNLLVVAGSIPKTISKSFYREIAERCQSNHIQLSADTSGEALQTLVGTKTFLLKPNHHELGDLFQVSISTPEDAIYYARKLVDQGAEHVMVSMGGDGAVFVSQETVLYAHVPKGEVKNSVGAGDSMVSGFLANYTTTQNVRTAFANGVAAGSATAFNDDLCQREEVEEMLTRIHIQEIE